MSDREERVDDKAPAGTIGLEGVPRAEAEQHFALAEPAVPKGRDDQKDKADALRVGSGTVLEAANELDRSARAAATDASRNLVPHGSLSQQRAEYFSPEYWAARSDAHSQISDAMKQMADASDMRREADQGLRAARQMRRQAESGGRDRDA